MPCAVTGRAAGCVRLPAPNWPRARAGTDYVIIARHGTLDRSWSDLTNDLDKALGYLHRQLDKGNLDKGNLDKGRSNGGRRNGGGRP